MKIRIREKGRPASDAAASDVRLPARIHIREKQVFFCKECSNKYYLLLSFCPQCLGEVSSKQEPQRMALKIVSVPDEKKSEVADFLRILSGKRSFPFEKSLQNLPWIFILETDRAVLQHWIEVLDPLKAELDMVVPPKKGRRKVPLFESEAPLPCFIPDSLKNAVRRVSMKNRNSPVQLKWADAVVRAIQVIESLYKQHALHRLVFSDFILKIERDLNILIQNFESGLTTEEELQQEIEKFKESVDHMRTEVEAVGRHVRDQL